MKRISFYTKIWLLLAFLVVLGSSACTEDEIRPTEMCQDSWVGNNEAHPKHAVFTQLLNQYTKQGLPGIVMLVRDANGSWVGAAGKADIERGIDMQICHVSKVASITKLFIGTLAVQLVDEGYFSLDDSLTKWVDESLISEVANADQATVRQVLNHTSGIPDVIKDNGFYLAVLNDPAKFWTPESLLPYLHGDEAVFPVGEDVRYSNTNLIYAVLVLEAATGKTQNQLMHEYILDPLDMEDSYYYWHDSLPDQVAQGYYDLYHNERLQNLSNYNTGSGNGYGGLYSTVFDLQTFIEALFREQTLLSPEALQMMQTYTPRESGNDRAFGITVNKDFLDRAPDEFGLGHRGRDLAYSADLYYFPNQDITVAYLVNYGTDGNSFLKPVFMDFREAVINALLSD